MANIIEEIQSEMNRCRELIKEYESIGPQGAFGKMMIGQDIQAGEQAIAEHDAIKMIKALEALRSCK